MAASQVYSHRLSPALNAKIMANIGATKIVVESMNLAAGKLDRIMTNGFPILCERFDTECRIKAAIAALQKAQQALDSTTWLDAADEAELQRTL